MTPKIKNNVSFFLLFPMVVLSQVGIGTLNPDSSSVLDISSTEKGILIPRMTTENRDLILTPARGLLVYNTTNSRLNFFSSVWNDFSTDYKTIVATETVTTESTVEELIPKMTLSPPEGNYLLTLNCQYVNNTVDVVVTIPISTAQCLADLKSVHKTLIAVPTTSTHGNNFNFGGGEIIKAGKYALNSAIAVGGVLILDGENKPDGVFIFQALGAINVAAASEIKLINGAQACNVFWVAEGAVNVGANSIMKGVLLSHGFAVAVGAQTQLEGNMFTTAGAIAFGPGTASIPLTLSTKFDLLRLSTFVAFTGSGAINNTGTPSTSFYNGDLASHAGDTGSLLAATVNGTIYPSGTNTVIISPILVTTASFSIFQNGVQISDSVRTISSKITSSIISLQDTVSVANGDTIEIRWKTDSGSLTVANRNLTLIKVQ